MAKTQKEDMDRREAQDKKTAEARKKSGDNRLRDSSTNNPLHRKSKWDQQMPGVSAIISPDLEKLMMFF